MSAELDNKNRRVGLAALGLAVSMVGLAYASVPLYALFCKVTGFGGTTQVAQSAPLVPTTSSITIRFDANASGELGWNFHPVQQTQKIKIGEMVLAHYEAKNTTSRTVTGTAVFNVTPPEVGVYFNKIECFCFTEQTLKPGQTAQMPVSYFVDPAILDNPDTKGIDEITLSYTFYPAKPKTPDKQADLQVN
jgi:cytochrome c oxidase assembly protein subunit 11